MQEMQREQNKQKYVHANVQITYTNTSTTKSQLVKFMFDKVCFFLTLFRLSIINCCFASGKQVN